MIDIAALVKNGQCKKFLAGQQIAGSDKVAIMYFLVSGSVSVFKLNGQSGPVMSGIIGPGEAFGGYEFFHGGNGTFFRASQDSIVYMITEQTFEDVARSHPQIIFEILKAAYAKNGSPASPEGRPAASAPVRPAPRRAAPPAPASPEPKRTAPPAPATPEPKRAAPPAPVRTAEAVQISGPVQVFPDGHKLYPAATNPEYKAILCDKTYKCPSCGKTFTDFKILQSKLYQSEPMRYDLRKYYKGFQMEWYEVITCPHCYYSMLYNYYAEPKKFESAAVQSGLEAARAAINLDFQTERDQNFVFASHYLALVCADGYLKNRRQIAARLWSNLSWLYEDAQDEAMSRFAAGKAAEANEALYMESTLTPVQEQMTCLAIAGMKYRAGITENMRKYLLTAKTNKLGAKAYAELAEDLMERLRAGKARS